MKKFNKFLSIILVIAILFSIVPPGVISHAAGEANKTTITDNSTHHHWHDDLEHSTKEIGRIWTDKTVWDADVVYPYEHQLPNQLGVNKGNSDLLVELSTLSSAATVNGKVTTSVPLDIVIVMDTSGSMADPMPSGEYTQRYQATQSISYQELYTLANDDSVYYQIGNAYYELTINRSGNYLNRRYTISYVKPGETTPTYIAQNAGNRNFTLEYALCTKDYISRLQGLKQAVNTFIDQTRVVNNSISEQAKKHRISLVEFAYAEDAQKLIDLTYVDSDTNVNTLKTSVNSLRANGATRADAGMDVAESILIGRNTIARADAQKVVIFFTDGTPTTQDTFSAPVANAAITSAKALKDADTVIYAIGVYEEADPKDLTKNFNQYMHGMSSNYPNATAYTSLGTRAEDSNYYLSATDAGSLNAVFTGILEDVTSIKANASTRVEEGNEGASGYITFVDPLGQYMQVDDFKAISFAEKSYTNKTTVTNGNITTYTFEGANSNNPIYPTTGNLNQIIITVEKSADLSVGDVVTVKIPGALIPIHYYEVNIDEDGKITMVEDTTLPIRIWYGVSVKDAVESALENPDAELKAYMEANKDTDGSIQFYSNLYTSGTQTVYSAFEPNQKNNFYFFQNDEYLYTDFECTQPATQLNDHTIYYYQRDYYHPKDNASYAGEAEKLINTTRIPGSSNSILAGYARADENGHYYIPKGAPRTTSITEYSLKKEAVFAGATNLTGTSEYAIDPTWLNVLLNPTTVQNELGNNGIVKITAPGTLAIKKLVTADEGLTAPEGKQFTFSVELIAPAGQALKESYNAQIFAADGTAVGSAFAFKPATNNTVILKDGQTVYIYGLAAGTEYRITETNLPDGFYMVDNSVVTGQISSGATSDVEITNNYRVSPISITGTELGLTGTKILEGRNFKDGDRFEFKVSATVFSPDAPLPSGVTNGIVAVEPTAGKSIDFNLGTFKFQKPGEYHYEIREIIPDAEHKLPGVSYDSTVYRIVITIADNGAGELRLAYLEIDKNETATAEWITVYSGDSLPGAGAKYAEFTNIYNSTKENIVLRGTKTLANKSLTDYSNNPFEFIIRAAGSRASGSSDAFVTDTDQPMPATVKVAATTTGDIIFPDIVFTGANIGKEYKYLITEVIPAGATTDGFGNVEYQGVTYDTSEKEVIINVTSVAATALETVVPEVVGNRFNFFNSYETNTVTYVPKGVKNLDGRDFRNGDSFKFEIEAIGDAPKPRDSQNNPITSVTIKPSSGNSYAFNFGSISFNQNDMMNGESVAGSSAKVKTFTYKLREIALSAAGIVYDTVERTLTIELKDNQGVLEIISVKLDGNAVTDNKIVWTNTYSASVTYSGLNIIKTLEGKTISKDEFSFKLTAEAGAPALSAEDQLFSVPFDAYYNPASDSASVAMPKLAGITFDQDDIGKTFSYIAEEVIPQTTGKITYDKSQYRIDLKPYDNGDGTMGVKTVVTQIVTANGQAVANGQKTEYDSADTAVPAVVFTNTYHVEDGVLSGAANLVVTKSFQGRDWTAADEFKFALELKSGTVSGAVIMPTETVITINKDTANHSKAFGDIRFTDTGIYVFTIQEQIPNGGKKDGITYDSQIHEIVVDVTNDGSGVYTVNLKSADTLTFVNTYAVESGTSVVINGEKAVKDMVLEDDDFTFELYTANENFEVSGDPITKTNQNGGFAFDLGYEPSDIGQTFYYVLREQNYGDIIDGVAYDRAQYHITVSVEDDGVGGAMATKTIVKDSTEVQEIKFVNEYAVRTGASIEIIGTKELSGRDINDGEFTFELLAADANFVPGDVVTSATNKADEFKITVNYLPGDVNQTFNYVLREKYAGEKVDGVTYDNTEYQVTVTLQDNGMGGMTAVKTVKKGNDDAGTVAFTNAYSTTQATAAIPVYKTLTGRTLKANEFTFKLFASDSSYAYDKDQALQIIRNTADGKFHFAELTFDTAGTYYYVVIEDTSVAVDKVTFDESIYLVKLVVKDNGKGALVVETPVITKKGSANSVKKITFKNVYTSETPPEKPTIPVTGDTWNPWLWFTLLFVSGFSLLVLNPKKKKAEAESR